jgi:hypothetical protein
MSHLSPSRLRTDSTIINSTRNLEKVIAQHKSLSSFSDSSSNSLITVVNTEIHGKLTPASDPQLLPSAFSDSSSSSECSFNDDDDESDTFSIVIEIDRGENFSLSCPAHLQRLAQIRKSAATATGRNLEWAGLMMDGFLELTGGDDKAALRCLEMVLALREGMVERDGGRLQ